MKTVDMSATDKNAKLFSILFCRVPVREVPGGHVEINSVANFESRPRTHARFLVCVEKAQQFEVSFCVGRPVEVAANCEHRATRRRSPGRAQRRCQFRFNYSRIFDSNLPRHPQNSSDPPQRGLTSSVRRVESPQSNPSACHCQSRVARAT